MDEPSILSAGSECACDSSMLDVANRYTRRGWSVIPVPHRSKIPGFRGWQELRLKEADLDERFNCEPQNIGVLLGEPSGWLIDVDLDHERAVELAPSHLPSTPTVFGRPGKPRSHWIYRVSSPMTSKQFRSNGEGTLLEIRSTGMQTVFPPSTHPSGERIEWLDSEAEPLDIDPEELKREVNSLVKAVRAALSQTINETSLPPGVSGLEDAFDDARRNKKSCLVAMLRMNMVDHNDGSLRMYAAACRTVEHDLSAGAALDVIRQYERQRPFKREWTDGEILKRFGDAERAVTRGAALRVAYDEKGHIELGTTDPQTGKTVLSPKQTLPSAKAFVSQFHSHHDGRTLHCHADTLLRWNGSCYRSLERGAFNKHLQGWLYEALQYKYDRDAKGLILMRFDSNPSTVGAVRETIQNLVHIPIETTSPAWLEHICDYPAHELLPCRGVLYHLPTSTPLPPTPALFVTNSLEIDPSIEAPDPVHWLAFLDELFEGDAEAENLLQEWFGYCLTADTSQQKMLLIVGPRRSGKGTIANVLRRIVGEDNISGPTTSSLAGPFGLQPLLQKTLAIVADARFSGEHMATVVERLLCISGEDALTVDRKYLPSITTKLQSRFTFLTNELPRFNETSGALAGRFLVLTLTKSFYGREDTGLLPRLLTELPGILNWAIAGWHRLHARGRFVMPQSSADAVQQVEYLASPMKAFVDECCAVGPGCRVALDDLFNEWSRWCERQGSSFCRDRQSFGRDLKSAFPGVSVRRSTGLSRFYSGIAIKSR